MTRDASPRVVFSIDFELRWGVHDILGPKRDAYREALLGVREVIPRLLELFADRGVRATWATVGALACQGWDEYFRRAPAPPAYADPKLVFDRRWADWDPDGELHFAPDLVQRIAAAAGQELASHTFSHIFLGELGVMARDVMADSSATASLFEERFGRRPLSLVFPRNQAGFFSQLRAAGIHVVRTNPDAWYWKNVDSDEPALFRGRRFLEGFATWQRHADAVASDPETGVLLTPASIFLRLARLPSTLFAIHLEKVKHEAKRLRDGEVLHLWFHPHNLGADPGGALGRLEAVLDILRRHLPAAARFATMAELQH